jgi:processive 1,2-diacylglycerol beta-glucosyltransferase
MEHPVDRHGRDPQEVGNARHVKLPHMSGDDTEHGSIAATGTPTVNVRMPTDAPRLLVLSVSQGAGHVRAAEAVTLALKELAPAATVSNFDVLTLTTALFRRAYSQAYLDMVNNAPHLLAYLYDMTDVPQNRRRKRDELRRLVQWLNLGRFERVLAEPWDLVINTHFLPADIIAGRRRRKKTTLRQVTVVTDFDAHAFWANQPTERYFVATEEAALSLMYWGVPREDIELTGIPIHPVFAQERSRAECREKHGLAQDRPVILLLAGGLGVGPIERVFETILSIEAPLQLVTVAGKNAALKARLDQIKPPARHAAKVLGFTTAMDELMAAADVVVSKPGGLTTAEILARGSAMVMMDPIPGQESRNSDYLLENGAAIKADSLVTLAHKLSRLLADTQRLGRLRAAAKALGHPRAAYAVAEKALAMASSTMKAK